MGRREDITGTKVVPPAARGGQRASNKVDITSLEEIKFNANS